MKYELVTADDNSDAELACYLSSHLTGGKKKIMIDVFLSRPTWVKRHVASHLSKLDTKLQEMGFQARTVGTNVTPFASPFDEVVDVLNSCQCAIILGLPYIRVKTGTIKDEEIEASFGLPTEWNHIEAAISLMLKLPTLMMLHHGVKPRGLFYRGSANVFIHKFNAMGPKWVDDTVPKLKELKDKVLAQQKH